MAGKTKERLKTDEQREAEAELAKLAKIKAAEDSQLFDRVFSTGDGKRVLGAIMKRCCFHNQITVVNTNGVDVQGMIHNAALHKHYLWLRQFIKPEVLREVENPLE